MRVTPKMIRIQTKPMMNIHCNTDSVRGEVQFKYSNKDPDQAASSGMDQSKARVSRGTQGGIEILPGSEQNRS